ncbi:MAG: class I SAM-dependent methyltransferase [Phycisphaerales bacterium]
MPDKVQSSPAKPARSSPLRLHIGGWETKPGWTIMDVLPKPGVVDILGNCLDLSQFADSSVEEIYASHVYEHLDYVAELPKALAEAFRVLKRGGLFRAGVPDLEVLCKMMIEPRVDVQDHFEVMRMIYGGQSTSADYHKVGFTFQILKQYLEMAGFTNVRRVESFGLFDDTSDFKFLGRRISLNVVAYKP